MFAYNDSLEGGPAIFVSRMKYAIWASTKRVEYALTRQDRRAMTMFWKRETSAYASRNTAKWVLLSLIVICISLSGSNTCLNLNGACKLYRRGLHYRKYSIKKAKIFWFTKLRAHQSQIWLVCRYYAQSGYIALSVFLRAIEAQPFSI